MLFDCECRAYNGIKQEKPPKKGISYSRKNLSSLFGIQKDLIYWETKYAVLSPANSFAKL
jgi:hypothetical protein